jgi:hypothetical protein
LKRDYPLYQSKLKEEDISKIRNTMLEEFKKIAKDTDEISMYAHYQGDKLLDEIFRKSDIVFEGGLSSLMVYPNDFCCTIHKNYATYWCDPGIDLDKKYKVPEIIIALTPEGAKELVGQGTQVKNYLNRNNILTEEEPLEERIKQLDNFKPKYDSWDFLYEDKKQNERLQNYKKIIEWTSEYITALLYDNCLLQKVDSKDLRTIKNFIIKKLKEKTKNKDLTCVNIKELTKEIDNNILNCFNEKINDDIYIYCDYTIRVFKNNEKTEKIIALTAEGAERILKDTNNKIWELAGNESNKEEIIKLLQKQQKIDDYLDEHEISKIYIKRKEELKKHKPRYGSLDFMINCIED